MKHWALNRYRCPVSGGPLALKVFEDHRVSLPDDERRKAEACGLPIDELERQIVSGILIGDEARVFYPILKGVPVLLDFPNPGHDRFEAEFADRPSAWDGLERPAGRPRPKSGKRAGKGVRLHFWK